MNLEMVLLCGALEIAVAAIALAVAVGFGLVLFFGQAIWVKTLRMLNRGHAPLDAKDLARSEAPASVSA